MARWEPPLRSPNEPWRVARGGEGGVQGYYIIVSFTRSTKILAPGHNGGCLHRKRVSDRP